VTTASQNTTSPTISVSTQDNNNFCVAGFAGTTPGNTFSATTGNLLTTGTSSNNVGVVLDNTVAVAPGTCTTTATNSGGGAANKFAVASVELRSVGKPAVDVIDVTSDPTSAGLTMFTSLAEPAGSAPFGVAAAPDLSRAYISLTGSSQFDVIANTATPGQISGGGDPGAPPFNLPDPSAAASAVSPLGVAIPPTTATPFQAYFTFSMGTAEVGIIDDGSPPTKDGSSPILLTTGSIPGRVRAIPVPQ
jgi:hypothetical protein